MWGTSTTGGLRTSTLAPTHAREKPKDTHSHLQEELRVIAKEEEHAGPSTLTNLGLIAIQHGRAQGCTTGRMAGEGP